MKIQAIGDRLVEYLEIGAGETVMALHCTGANAKQWRSLGDCIASSFRLIAPNMQGIGRSSSPPSTASWLEEEVSTAHRLLDQIAEPVHLVGHSYGGHVALRLATRRRPSLKTLVLVEPALAGGRSGSSAVSNALSPSPENGHERFIEEFFDRVGPLGGWSAIPSHTQNWIRAHRSVLAAQIASIGKDDEVTGLDLRKIDVPTLLVKGGKSDPRIKGNVDRIHSLVAGAGIITIPEAGHMLPISHAAEFNEIIAHFLAEHRRSEDVSHTQ